MLDTSIAKLSLGTEPFSIASAPPFPDLAALRRSSATLALNNGQLTDFQTSGDAARTIAIAQSPTDSSTFLQSFQGRTTINQGIFTSDLGGSLSTQDAEKLIRNFVEGISGRVLFADGKIDLEIPTEFGDATGSIEFGNGALVTNLATPLGNYFSSLDFRDSDQLKFTFDNNSGVVNLNDGLVILDFQPQTPGDQIAIPINALSGSIAFTDGQATVNFPTPFGAVATNLDLSSLATTATAELL